MTTQRMHVNLLAGIFLLVFGSCSKNDTAPSQPTNPPAASDLSFPSSTKFALTLYSPESAVAVGSQFEVKVVLYNVSNLFGAAIEVGYSPQMVEIQNVVAGTDFFPSARTLTLNRIEPDSLRVSFAATYKAGDVNVSSGSGIAFKLQCRAIAGGSAPFVINAQKLSLKKSDGVSIDNFANLQKENLTLTIR